MMDSYTQHVRQGQNFMRRNLEPVAPNAAPSTGWDAAA